MWCCGCLFIVFVCFGGLCLVCRMTFVYFLLVFLGIFWILPGHGVLGVEQDLLVYVH